MELHVGKLKAIRKRKKITASELANMMGITRVTLGTWENGKIIPSEFKIRMIAKVLDIPVSEISNLQPEKAISENNFISLNSSLETLLSVGRENKQNRTKSLCSGIMDMEKELYDAKVIIEAMISSLSLIFYIKGPDLKYITVNEAFFKNLSLNKNHPVMGKTDSDFFPKKEAKINQEMDREVLVSGKSILNLEGIIFGSRRKKWGLISKIPIFDSEGKIQGLVGSFVDITERKKAEKYYECIVNMSFDLICVAGMDGYFKFVNPAWEKVLGYTSEELLSQPFLNFIYPDDHSMKHKEMENLASGKHTVNYENRYIHKDGSIRYFLWTATSIPNEKLNYRIGKDITDIKKANKLIEQSENKFKYLAENLSELIYTVDPQSLATTYVNNAVKTIYGYTKEEWYRDPYLWKNSIYSEDKEYVLNEVVKSQKEKSSIVINYRIIRKDKTLACVENHISWEKDMNGNIVSMNALMYDSASANKRLELIREIGV